MNSATKVDVAVVGASGAVGEAMVEILEEREFPVGELHLLASARSAGKTVRAFGRTHTIGDLAEFDFSTVQLGLFSPGGAVSAEYAPRAAAADCYVVDNTSYFRMDPEVPLIVPEVNGDVLSNYAGHIIANPNCSTIAMLMALKPIYDAVGIKRINVDTYQAVSGAGRSGVLELAGETAALLNGKNFEAEGERVFQTQIAFNAIPQIGAFSDNGYTAEELKMVDETRKIFDDAEIEVNPTCVRVPVFYGHSEALALELGAPLSADEARKLLRAAPGVKVLQEANKSPYPTPVGHAAGNDAVYVGRVRNDLFRPNGLNLWIAADNVRKGAALNSVQIAELLLHMGALG